MIPSRRPLPLVQRSNDIQSYCRHYYADCAQKTTNVTRDAYRAGTIRFEDPNWPSRAFLHWGVVTTVKVSPSPFTSVPAYSTQLPNPKITSSSSSKHDWSVTEENKTLILVFLALRWFL